MSQSRFVSAARGAVLLVAALILVDACADSGPTGPAVAVSVTPTTATVTAGLTTTLAATVTNHSNTAVTWSVQEAATGGTVSAAGVYTAPATPGTYHVIATSVARPTKSASATITVVAMPSITAFTATAGTLTTGGSTMLTATFSGGAGTVNQSIGTVSTGTAVSTGALTATRVYTLTVTNAAGTAVTAQTTVTVVLAPVITSFVATPATVSVGGSSTLLAVFANGVGYVAPGNVAITSGVGLSTGPLAASTSRRLVVKNAAGDSVTADAAITVVAAPTIASFTATPATITTGGASTLLAVFAGGTAYLNPGMVAITSGVGLGTGALTATGTYQLVVKNVVGDSVTANVTVTVVPAPVITSFIAVPDTITSGGSAMLTAVFAGGTAYVNPGMTAVTSGVGLSTGALTVAGTTDFTYTVVVKNAAGDSVMTNATVTVVTPLPVISSFTATPPVITLGDASTLAWTATGATSLSIDQGVGTVTGSSSVVSPTGTLTYTLTATNGSGSVTSTATVTVVPAPSITSFTATPSAVVAGGASSLRAVFAQGTGVVDQAIGAVTSATPTPTGAIATSTLYTLTVTNLAGSVATATATVAVDPGFYITTNPMTVARRDHRTVMLANGTVLAIAGSPATATAETYDATPDAWTATTGLMTVPREGPEAVLLADGRVLISGGAGSSSEILSSAELYDPATRTFAATGAMTTPRYGHSMHLLDDGRVLVVGGVSAVGTPVVAAEIYNPTTGTFTATGSMGSAFRFPVRLAPLAGGDVLVMGGNGADFDGSSVEIYDVSAGTFGPTGGTTAGHLTAGTRLLDGSVLAVGNTVVKRWSGGATSATGPMLRLFQWAASTILPNGHVLIASDSGSSAGVSESQIYDPGTNSFRLTGKPFESRSFATANLLRTGNVLITGGFGSAGAGQLATSELYINGTGGTAPAPSATITTPGTATTATSMTISVPATSGARYIWRVTGGTITAGLGTNEITVTAGPVGTMAVSALVVSELGIPSYGTGSVAVQP